MDTVSAKFTVFFEEPFYVGLYERECGEASAACGACEACEACGACEALGTCGACEACGTYEACKVTFGAAPKDGEVYAFLLENRRRLCFTPASGAAGLGPKAGNPKRMQRAVQRQLQAPALSTKAQQALKLQQEQNGQARKARSRQQREEEQARRFAMRQQKRKEKHKGH